MRNLQVIYARANYYLFFFFFNWDNYLRKGLSEFPVAIKNIFHSHHLFQISATRCRGNSQTRSLIKIKMHFPFSRALTFLRFFFKYLFGKNVVNRDRHNHTTLVSHRPKASSVHTHNNIFAQNYFSQNPYCTFFLFVGNAVVCVLSRKFGKTTQKLFSMI